MKHLKYVIAALLVSLPAFFATTAADALTARQYQQQGRGHYIHSTGNRPSRAIYHRHGHRHSRHHGRGY